MPTGRGRAPFVSIAQRYVRRGRSSQPQFDLGPETEPVACAHDPAQAGRRDGGARGLQPSRPRRDHGPLRRGLRARDPARARPYARDGHFVSGDRGLSEWTITGTTVEGERIEVRGCDLWTFGADDTVTRKDSFWKLREP